MGGEGGGEKKRTEEEEKSEGGSGGGVGCGREMQMEGKRKRIELSKAYMYTFKHFKLWRFNLSFQPSCIKLITNYLVSRALFTDSN